MQKRTWYVIKPTMFERKKVDIGDELELTHSQARPLQNGGFITADKNAVECIKGLLQQNKDLKVKTGGNVSKNDLKKKEGDK